MNAAGQGQVQVPAPVRHSTPPRDHVRAASRLKVLSMSLHKRGVDPAKLLEDESAKKRAKILEGVDITAQKENKATNAALNSQRHSMSEVLNGFMANTEATSLALATIPGKTLASTKEAILKDQEKIRSIANTL